MLTQLALAPSAVLVLFLLAFDKYAKEPLWLMAVFFIYGGFSVVISMAVISVISSWGIQNSFPFLYTALFSSAFPEELIKAVFIYLLFVNNRFINEPFDFILYPCIFALGFASAENIIYVYHPFLGGVSTALTRAVFSMPGHFLFAVSFGYGFAGGKCLNFCRKNIFKGFLYALILHFFYNGILLFGEKTYLFVFIPYVFLLWKRGLKKMMYMQIKYDVNIS